MPTVMTLELDGGDHRTLADWSIDPDVTKVTKSQAPDTLSFRMTLQDGTAEHSFPNGSRIILRRDVNQAVDGTLTGGTIVFVGTVVEHPVVLGPQDETHLYTAVGPWWDLENITFQQQWFSWDGSINPETLKPTAEFEAKDTTHVIIPWKVVLDEEVGGIPTILTVEEQIQEAITFAIDRSGVAIQLGDVDIIRTAGADGFDAITVALNEYRDITVAEVIKNILRWSPDAVTWWDYTTLDENDEPAPTFHCRIWKRLETVTWALGDGTNVKSDITPRYDLRRDGVVCRFEKRNEADGQVIMDITEQKWPADVNTAGVGVMVVTFDLEGARRTTIKTQVEVGTIDAFSADAAVRLEWWKEKIPWLKTGYIRNISVAVGTRNGELNLARELTVGTIPDWMGVQSEDETIKAELSYEKWSAETGGELQQKVGLSGNPPQVITVDIVSTDAETGTYSNATDDAYGEAEPAGLARFLYDSAAILHYSGSIEDTRQECVGTINVGKRLNLTGGKAAWATMQAMVVSVTERFHTGETAVKFGPPEYLAPQDFLEFHRVNRRERWRWTTGATAATGIFGGGSTVEIGRRTPKVNSTSGPTGGGDKPVWLP
jgi:hypothetical protein